MNWNTGMWRLKDEAGSESRITVCGDWVPRRYEEIIKQNPEAVYGDVLPELRSGELAIVNVECALGDEGEPIPKGGPNLRGETATVTALTAVPFHVACLANNHTVDFGAEGLASTMEILEQAGLQTVGAGMTGEQAAEPLRVTLRDGTRVGILNCADGEECRSVTGGPGVNGLDVDRLKSQMNELIKSGHFVMVVYHGGREHAVSPPPYVVRALREIAAHGADIVIAHHPHVPQGMEWVGGVPILYSLGNFVFYQNNEVYYNHVGYLAHLDIGQGKLRGLELIPYHIRPSGLELMKGQEKQQFMHELEQLSDRLCQPDGVNQLWDAFIDETGLEQISGSLISFARELHSQPVKGAALLHNVFFTPAHSELYLDAFRRMKEGRFGDSPPWARMYVRKWLERKLDS